MQLTQLHAIYTTQSSQHNLTTQLDATTFSCRSVPTSLGVLVHLVILVNLFGRHGVALYEDGALLGVKGEGVQVHGAGGSQRKSHLLSKPFLSSPFTGLPCAAADQLRGPAITFIMGKFIKTLKRGSFGSWYALSYDSCCVREASLYQNG